MDYKTVLSRLYALSPKGMKLGLDRVRLGAALLGDPQHNLDCVQIAGTNGKGTVSYLLARFAQAAGLKVGLYTSPHLHRFSERIRIDGREASLETIGRHLVRILDLLDENPDLGLTFFEVATLAAFAVFAESKVDLAVLEVGLGGRLDATSIASPKATAITSVGFDHTELLGRTLGEIAREKAAIARDRVPMVAGSLQPEALEAVQEQSGKAGAPLYVLGRDFQIQPGLKLPWPGEHNRHNAAIAMKLFEFLDDDAHRLTRNRLEDALASAAWPARFEFVKGRPSFILDGAHNVEGVRALVQALAEFAERPSLLLFGALRGKPIDQMLGLLRQIADRVVLVKPPIDRACDPVDYAAPRDLVASSVHKGLELARSLTHENDTVLVTGSLFTVAEVRRLLLNEPSDLPIGM